MSRAVFPGSFDPVTVGHMDLIKRAANMFDELVVAVLVNVSKQPLLALEERVDLLEALLKDMPGVSVQPFEGMLVDFVRDIRADVIVRGLRTAADFEYELPITQTNRHMNPQVDTIFMVTAPEYSYISSSGVKEILAFHGDVQDFVPEPVYQWLQTKS